MGMGYSLLHQELDTLSKYTDSRRRPGVRPFVFGPQAHWKHVTWLGA